MKSKRQVLVGIAASLLAISQLAFGAPIRILPLGDSITQGQQEHEGYRRPLWHKLVQAGITPDFIGTQSEYFDGPALNPDFDVDHEGHGGWKAEELLGYLPGWLTLYTPDVCLLHAGSNDAFHNDDPASTVSELGQIIDTLREDNPSVVVLLAKIFPRADPYSQRITNLNAQLDGLAAAKTRADSPVIVVDQHTGFDPATDSYDGIHPNNAAAEEMATRWFDMLLPVISETRPPRPPAGLQAQSGNEQITLSWSAPLFAEAYNVKRSTTNGGPYTLIANNLAATAYTDSGLSNGTTYFYVVTATNDYGESQNSAEVSATPNTGPVPILKVSFDEPNGTITPNHGTAGGTFTLTTPQPERVTNVPTNGGSGAIDMGTSEGDYAVDSAEPISALVGLDRFTLTGWLNNRSVVQASSGNRVVSCIDDDGDGFELIYKGDGSLTLTVNGIPDSDSPRSSAGQVPEDFFAEAANWRFFAVTYDATSARVRFYFGSNTSDATLDQIHSYTGRGAIGPGLGRLTIGHVNPATRASFLGRMFRGMIDEVQVFGTALSLSEIITVQRGGSVAPPAPAPAADFSGSPTNGGAPLLVDFIDSSTGSITNRFWNFGDGVTTNTTATNLSHTYQVAGTNTVSLTVMGAGGSNMLARPGYIVVTNPATRPGLVGEWKLDAGSGTLATDSSGLGQHGTLLNGPIWTNGQCNSALHFDGANDYVRVTDADALDFANTNFTMALWVRTTRTSAQALVEKQHSGFSGFFLLALNRDNAVPGGVSVWTGDTWIDSNFRGLTDGQWHHLAVTYDGSAFRLYRDGILDKTMAASAPYVATQLPLNFGRFATANTGWFFQGQMDEISRYSRALSASEIAALTQCANSPPVANFSGSPTHGPAPLTINFTDNSSGSITNRFWSFGDGTITNTTSTSLTHTYTGPGTNNVSLTVSGPSGSNTLTRVAYIVVTNVPPPPPPVANFSGAPTNGGAPLTVNFTDTSTGSITQRLWNFGDGTATNTTATSLNHLYGEAGTNSVSLTVIGPGGSNALARSGYIVITNATTTPDLVGDWKLDDGSGSTATDSSGKAHHGTLVNGPVWTNGYCAGGLNFDGVNDYVQVPSTGLLEFAGRSFTLALRVKSTRSGPQTLVEKQHGGFSGFFLLALNRDNAVPGGLSVWTGNTWIDSNFRGLTDGQWHHVAVTYDGSSFRLYRDGILDKTTTASAPYLATQLPLNFGRFVTGNIGWFFQGQMDEIRRYNRALSGAEVAALTQCANAPPVAQFSGNPTASYAPLTVSFTDSSTGSITNRFWSFGDSATTNTMATTLAHTYAMAGTYTVALTASGPAGSNTLTRSDYIAVTNATPPVANFSGNPTNGETPLSVTFTDTSSGIITNRFWDFGDGQTTNATTSSVSHLYNGAGTNTVSLTVRGPGGSNTLTRTSYITVTSPPPRSLTVMSFNPSNGVAIAISPLDLSGQSNGVTTFNRTYAHAAMVTLTAPPTVGTNTFQRWERNAASLGTNRTVTVTLDSDSTLLARYQPPGGASAGLLGHWKLDDGSGTTATDASGLAHHGTLLNGPIWTNGQCSGALNFDGANDYMRVADADPLDFANTNFTVALWVRTTRTGAQALVEKQHNNFTGFFLLALNRDNAVPGGFSIYNGNSWIDSTFRGVTNGQWHHLAVTYDGSALRLYRDGILDQTKTGVAYYAPTTLPLNFGRFVTGNIGWYFRGEMDDIRRYNRALPTSEIASLMQCPPGQGVQLTSIRRPPAPALRLEPSSRQADGTFRLVIRNADETPLTPERVKRLEIFATSDLSLPLNEWTKLNNRFVWVDGTAQWDDPESAQLTQRFYMLRERP